MSYWIELHCDMPTSLRNCQTQMTGAYPSLHVGSSKWATAQGLKNLDAAAKAKGWIKLRDGRWKCPHCVAYDANLRIAREEL